MNDTDKLPAGKTCGDCANWQRCFALICSLNPKADECDFGPSRFREKAQAT